MIEEREGEGERSDTRPERRSIARQPGSSSNGWRKTRTRETESERKPGLQLPSFDKVRRECFYTNGHVFYVLGE